MEFANSSREDHLIFAIAALRSEVTNVKTERDLAIASRDALQAVCFQALHQAQQLNAEVEALALKLQKYFASAPHPTNAT